MQVLWVQEVSDGAQLLSKGCGHLNSHKGTWCVFPRYCNAFLITFISVLFKVSFLYNTKKTFKKELIYKTETDSQITESNLRLPKGKHGGGIKRHWRLTYTHTIYIQNTQLTRTYCRAQGDYSIFCFTYGEIEKE